MVEVGIAWHYGIYLIVKVQMKPRVIVAVPQKPQKIMHYTVDSNQVCMSTIEVTILASTATD